MGEDYFSQEEQILPGVTPEVAALVSDLGRDDVTENLATFMTAATDGRVSIDDALNVLNALDNIEVSGDPDNFDRATVIAFHVGALAKLGIEVDG